MASVEHRYHFVIISASAAFAASAVALPAHVALDPFVHFLLSCNCKKNKKTAIRNMLRGALWN